MKTTKTKEIEITLSKKEALNYILAQNDCNSFGLYANIESPEDVGFKWDMEVGNLCDWVERIASCNTLVYEYQEFIFDSEAMGWVQDDYTGKFINKETGKPISEEEYQETYDIQYEHYEMFIENSLVDEFESENDLYKITWID